ncbi:RDD family protein [Chitinophaga silvisoli]|uniref:RDD family protein n=1 Tax=Chitinophaga silvisoli TaxID=2291814 RepID=A0A3E1P7I3_9BACT|nr:RDD family protein [Chitinophaga silvisoli]RFM36159.1 RDD family protein [Chitinophaga silvisoli]
MANVKIPTSFNIELEFETANILVRFLAWIIDLLIRIAFGIAIYVTFSRMHLAGNTATVMYILFCALPISLYYLLFEITMNGQSPGKMMLGIKVRSLNGSKPSISQHLIRWLFRLLEAPWGIFFLNGAVPIITMIRSRYDQRLGDVVAGTIVVNTKNKTSIQDTIYRDMSSLNYEPHFPQILRLSDRDMNKIKTLMDQAIKSGNQDLIARVAERVKEVLGIETEMGHFQFLETVLNDYNYYTTR